MVRFIPEAGITPSRGSRVSGLASGPPGRTAGSRGAFHDWWFRHLC